MLGCSGHSTKSTQPNSIYLHYQIIALLLYINLIIEARRYFIADCQLPIYFWSLVLGLCNLTFNKLAIGNVFIS